MTKIVDLLHSDGPSRADLKELERLEHRRRDFEELKPEGEHQATVRKHLLDYIDVMEEIVCEEGRHAPFLAEGWQRIEELEARYWEGRAEAEAREDAGTEPSKRKRRPNTDRRRRGSTSPRRRCTARKSGSSPKAA